MSVQLRWIQRSACSGICVRFRRNTHLADLGFIGEPDFLNDTLFFAEIASDGLGSAHATFAFSQTVAKIVGEHFDGMIVPGVRGDSQCRYRNIVIFRPHTHWTSWLDPTWEPRACASIAT